MKYFLIPVLIFLFLIYGCESVKTYYVDKEKFQAEKVGEGDEGVVKIVGLFLKSGEYVDVRGKNAKPVLNGETRMINYESPDQNQNNIALDSISTLKMQLASNNYLVPVAIVAGAAVFLMVLLWIALHSLGKFNITG